MLVYSILQPPQLHLSLHNLINTYYVVTIIICGRSRFLSMKSQTRERNEEVPSFISRTVSIDLNSIFHFKRNNFSDYRTSSTIPFGSWQVQIDFESWKMCFIHLPFCSFRNLANYMRIVHTSKSPSHSPKLYFSPNGSLVRLRSCSVCFFSRPNCFLFSDVSALTASSFSLNNKFTKRRTQHTVNSEL